MGRFLREAEGVLDVEDVLLGEGVILVEPLGRHAEAATVYLYVVEDRQETLDVLVDTGEHGACEVLGRPLGHAMFGHRGRHREDSWVRQRHLHAPSRSPPMRAISPMIPSSSTRTNRQGCVVKCDGAIVAAPMGNRWCCALTSVGRKGPFVVLRRRRASKNFKMPPKACLRAGSRRSGYRPTVRRGRARKRLLPKRSRTLRSKRSRTRGL